MGGDDPVNDEAMIFTEADVYGIAGYLAELWGFTDDVVADVERAITSSLSRR